MDRDGAQRYPTVCPPPPVRLKVAADLASGLPYSRYGKRGTFPCVTLVA
jgi:hypothetical protein